jgi:5-formyltetrahydrofolate cyclo-ligase
MAPTWFLGQKRIFDVHGSRGYLFLDGMTVQKKESLRHEAIRHRDRIDPGSENFDSATALFFEHINPVKGQAIGLYWAKGREFNTDAIMERLLKDKFECALPVMRDGTKELGFALWKDGDALAEGPFDIKQPVIDVKTKWIDPDIVVVPLLAFDRRGYRLGYGSGYYDVTLRALRNKKKIIAVGLGYGQQAVLFNLPSESHDEKLDWVITPQKAHCFMESK